MRQIGCAAAKAWFCSAPERRRAVARRRGRDAFQFIPTHGRMKSSSPFLAAPRPRSGIASARRRTASIPHTEPPHKMSFRPSEAAHEVPSEARGEISTLFLPPPQWGKGGGSSHPLSSKTSKPPKRYQKRPRSGVFFMRYRIGRLA